MRAGSGGTGGGAGREAVRHELQRRQGRKSTALAETHQARLLLSLLLVDGVFADAEPAQKVR